jgi:ribonuclease HI
MKRIEDYFRKIDTDKENTGVNSNDNDELIKENVVRGEPLVVFTDGSFVPGKYAGYSVVFPDYQEYNMCKRLSGKLTNNRAEFSGMIKALEIADEIDQTGDREVILYTDSELLVNTVSKWMRGWKARGWKKADKKPVKNLDLVMKLDIMTNKRKVIMRHVRAHTGLNDYCSRWNDVADKLAKSTGSQKHDGSFHQPKMEKYISI